MTSPDPTDRERFNYEILKYELETFQSRYKNFEKTYLLIIGISIFYYLFFIKFLYASVALGGAAMVSALILKNQKKRKELDKKIAIEMR